MRPREETDMRQQQRLRSILPWIALPGILVAAWWLSKRFGGSGEALWTRTIRRHTQTLGIVSIALLAAYLLYLRLSISRARRGGGGKDGPDPSLIGCFSFVAAVVTVLILVLAVGLLFRIALLVKIISGITIAIALYFVVGLLYDAIRGVMKKLAGRRSP
jgi:hypothetical protein